MLLAATQMDLEMIIPSEVSQRKANIWNLGFPGGSDGKESACDAGDTGDAGSIPSSSERFPGKKHDNPLQYSCLENYTDRGAWWAIVYGVVKSRTGLNN